MWGVFYAPGCYRMWPLVVTCANVIMYFYWALCGQSSLCRHGRHQWGDVNKYRWSILYKYTHTHTHARVWLHSHCVYTHGSVDRWLISGFPGVRLQWGWAAGGLCVSSVRGAPCPMACSPAHLPCSRLLAGSRSLQLLLLSCFERHLSHLL